ncbi:hypothetical protein EDB86DRAFT_2835320 [Lactarius hatsudake]|nr:hypothetical protein EDB86DRAFT_2835320 [Lactarius hatsudake]
MGHLLNLSEQEHDAVINNLLMMGGSAATPQINAIGLDFTLSPTMPLRDVAFQLDTVPGSINPLPVLPPFLADLASLSRTNSPPPRPPRSPRRPCSPWISPPPLPVVVEDDHASKRGVETSPSALVSLIPTTSPQKITLPAPVLNKSPPQTSPQRPSRSPPVNEPPRVAPSVKPQPPPCSPLRTHQPVFLANAFERPRDPDEVTPQVPSPSTPRPPASQSARKTHCEDTRNTTQTMRDPVSDRNRGRQTHDARRSRRTLYTTNNDIHAWLQQIVYNNPSPHP